MSRQIRDLTGKKYGKWTVLSFAGVAPKGASTIATWNCRCECGNERVVDRGSLTSGNSKSCGCTRGWKHRPNGRPKGSGKPLKELAVNLIVNNIRNSAKAREYEFTLSPEEVSELVFSDCFYCGAPPNNLMLVPHRGQAVKYNGLDRVENTRGYTPENVVPCCRQCNTRKHTSSRDEFLEWVKRVYLNHY